MKRFLTLLAVISMTLVAMAQNQVATLSHEGELKSYTGMYALADALDASQDGDTIFLSEGEFMHRGNASNSIEIGKRISIVGCGYDSHIIPTIFIRFGSQSTSWDGVKQVFFDGVRIKELTFYNDYTYRNRLGYFSIRNCWIGNMGYCGYAGNNCHIDRCLIDALYFNSEEGNNVYIYNSKIGEITSSAHYYYVTNCNIKKAKNLPCIVTSSIIENCEQNDNWYHTADNSLFPENKLKSSVQAHDCYFENPENGLLDEDLNVTIDLQAKGYLGQDGKIIGAYGGEDPFSEYPSVPTIDSANSSVEFDSESNQLNVTITLVPN